MFCTVVLNVPYLVPWVQIWYLVSGLYRTVCASFLTPDNGKKSGQVKSDILDIVVGLAIIRTRNVSTLPSSFGHYLTDRYASIMVHLRSFTSLSTWPKKAKLVGKKTSVRASTITVLPYAFCDVKTVNFTPDFSTGSFLQVEIGRF